MTIKQILAAREYADIFEFNYINIFRDTVTGYFKFPEPITQEKIEDNFKKWIDSNCVKSWYKEIIFNEGE